MKPLNYRKIRKEENSFDKKILSKHLKPYKSGERSRVRQKTKRQTIGEQLIESLHEAIAYEQYLQEEKDQRNYPLDGRRSSKAQAKTKSNKKARLRKGLQTKV